VLENSGVGRLRAVLGIKPHSPLDVAVRNTLIGFGCGWCSTIAIVEILIVKISERTQRGGGLSGVAAFNSSHVAEMPRRQHRPACPLWTATATRANEVWQSSDRGRPHPDRGCRPPWARRLSANRCFVHLFCPEHVAVVDIGFLDPTWRSRYGGVGGAGPRASPFPDRWPPTDLPVGRRNVCSLG
jgi:hypothetical protein